MVSGICGRETEGQTVGADPRAPHFTFRGVSTSISSSLPSGCGRFGLVWGSLFGPGLRPDVPSSAGLRFLCSRSSDVSDAQTPSLPLFLPSLPKKNPARSVSAISRWCGCSPFFRCFCMPSSLRRPPHPSPDNAGHRKEAAIRMGHAEVQAGRGLLSTVDASLPSLGLSSSRDAQGMIGVWESTHCCCFRWSLCDQRFLRIRQHIRLLGPPAS